MFFPEVMEFQPDFSPRNGMEASVFSKDPGIPALFFNNDIIHRVFPWIFLLTRGTFHRQLHGFNFLTQIPSIGKSMDFF